MLASPDFRARAAATRVLCYWRDRVPDALELLKKLAADAHPRVRLEAVRAASFFTGARSGRGLRSSPPSSRSDEYLDFVRGETHEGARSVREEGHRRGQQINVHHDRPARGTSSSNVSTDDLLKMSDDRGVCRELLFRTGVRDEFRREALDESGEAGEQTELRRCSTPSAVRTTAQRDRRDESVVLRPGPPADAGRSGRAGGVAGRAGEAGDRRRGRP